jgi:CHAD domain-containing protein
MSDEEIHSLRIEFKKLRYFIEYFNSLITNKNLLKDFGYLKKAQDFLGKNQDIFFQIEIINNFLSENTEDIIDIKKIKDILIEEKANNMVQFMKFYKKIQKLLK